jgi:nitroreductase
MAEPLRTIPFSLEFRDRDEMLARSRAFHDELSARRTVRQFSDRAIPIEAVVNCIRTAASAPSGANKQPWTFVLVTDRDTKRKIREAAEQEERAFYGGRAPKRWLDDLAPLGTDWQKPFLDIAPALIAVFAQKHGADADERHYYVNESVGIAVGFLLAALHHCGLATLTHTPSPMNFLRDILGRPDHERAYVLVPVGYPADDCRVPAITRKPLDEVLVTR